MRANAAFSSVIGSVASIRGLIFPSPYQIISSSIIAAAAFGSRFAKSPQKTPTTDAPLSSIRLSGNAGIGPDAKPTTRCRPRQAIDRNAASVCAPPTGSQITSGPLPDVIDLIASRRFCVEVSIVASAPAERQNAHLASLDAAAMTRAPAAFAIWIAALPTPPAAPSTSTVSPGFTCARSMSAWCDVAYVMMKAAASTAGNPGGSGTHSIAFTTACVANAPTLDRHATR